MQYATTTAADRFQDRLETEGLRLRRTAPAILQLNLGKLCNLTCLHCHVSAGPRRREIITAETVDRILAWYAANPLPTVDLTGGAPEMVPDFRRLVTTLRRIRPDVRLIDRCNLVILNEPGYDWLGGFLLQHQVEVVASMPCYSPENVDAQRGNGVFDRSIEALRQLNALGYGRGDPALPLHLVYNPGGESLPPDQAELEADYKRELDRVFGITFDRLFALANLPIARFATYLRKRGRYEDYLHTLMDAFNPATVDGLMCRDTISVSWEGKVYDCDFNQMLGMQLRHADGTGLHLWDLDPAGLPGRPIATGNHCFGCTAGAGSSCGGSLVN